MPIDMMLPMPHTSTYNYFWILNERIVQGGLDVNLRKVCLENIVKRNLPGYAIGGLSGGESKEQFWKIVTYCTDLLPRHKPRYLMGVGFAVDLVVCVALGIDMFDCVYPRWGTMWQFNTLIYSMTSFVHFVHCFTFTVALYQPDSTFWNGFSA